MKTQQQDSSEERAHEERRVDCCSSLRFLPIGQVGEGRWKPFTPLKEETKHHCWLKKNESKDYWKSTGGEGIGLLPDCE